MASVQELIELPGDDVNLEPPTQAEVEAIASAVVHVLVYDTPANTELTDLQRVLMEAVFESMTGHRPSLAMPVTDVDPLDVLRSRNLAFRTRIVQQMILGVLVVRPPSRAAVARIRSASRRLGVEEGMIDVAAAFADGQFDLALADFERNGYTANWDDSRADVLHSTGALTAPWQLASADPELAARWLALEGLAEGSLGLAVSRFYRARGFNYPGTQGSVSPLLAQHDWVHVLANYGATIENELEVFAFIARANDDPRGFSFLAMVVSLFESGMLSSGAGLFEPDAGHLQLAGMPERIADAMLRGARCKGSVDFLGLDWFSFAHRQLDDLRGEFGITPQRSGIHSTGPFDPGGMTASQWQGGHAAAQNRGVEYQSWGATPG
jgi:hypothetical protein